MHKLKTLHKTGFELDCVLLANLVSVSQMGRPMEVAFLLALFVLLGSMHGTRAQFDNYDYEDYDVSVYDLLSDEDEDVEEEDYLKEDTDASAEPIHCDSHLNPAVPCWDVSVPEPDKLVESSENSLSVHLDGWLEFNCPTSYFAVEQR